jgi:hypothetical protein
MERGGDGGQDLGLWRTETRGSSLVSHKSDGNQNLFLYVFCNF